MNAAADEKIRGGVFCSCPAAAGEVYYMLEIGKMEGWKQIL